MNIYDMTCEFIKVNNFQYKCRVCGTIVSSFDETEYPTLICAHKLSLYNPAEFGIKISHIENNTNEKESVDAVQKIDDLKKCSVEEIEERFAICSSCEHYKNNTCEKCGCYLVRSQIYMNKLAWKDQECPIGKWKKLI